MDESKLYQSLGQIEGKVDAILVNQENHKTRLDNHAGRIDNLEETRDRQRGAAKVFAVLVTFAGLIGGWLKYGGDG